MAVLLHLHEGLCRFLIRALLEVVVAIDEHRRSLPRGIRRWRGSLRRLVGRERGARHHPRKLSTGRAWNRTPDFRERQVVELHVRHGWGRAS